VPVEDLMPEPRTRCPEGDDSGCNRGCNEIVAEEGRDFVPESRNEGGSEP